MFFEVSQIPKYKRVMRLKQLKKLAIMKFVEEEKFVFSLEKFFHFPFAASHVCVC